MSTPTDYFHAHLDACSRCRTTLFDLCADGALLLRISGVNELCACGQPLHYSNAETLLTVQRVIDFANDPLVLVTVGDRRWRVQRHWIALHGLKASELPTIAAALGFEEKTDG